MLRSEHNPPPFRRLQNDLTIISAAHNMVHKNIILNNINPNKSQYRIKRMNSRLPSLTSGV